MLKHLFLIVLLLFGTYLNTINAQEAIPSVIPPSPETASITKYVDMKINEYHGMVQHQVPIYQINEGSIQLPISLNYQSGGFKVTESASSVGLGWSLNAGGVITRSMYGLPDDDSNNNLTKGFLTVSSETNYDYLSRGENSPSRASYLESIGRGCFDSQPDIFHFNFNGYSGKFHFNWNREIVISSEHDIQITPIQSHNNLSKINGWIFKTPNGLIYRFQTAEVTSNISTGGSFCFSHTQTFNSAWYLTEIIDVNTNRKLLFEYDTYNIKDHITNIITSRTHLVSGDNNNCGGNLSGNLNSKTLKVDISGVSLRRIYSNTSSLEILFVPGSLEVLDDSEDHLAIEEIQIKDAEQNKIIKKYKLKHDYETGWLTLKSIQEFGKNSSNIPAYQFYYHKKSSSGIALKKKDHWGFLNNNNSFEVLPPYFFSIPGTGNRIAQFGSADRSPDFEGSRNGVLYKVKYPTGGFDVYEFEQNTYGYIGGTKINEFKKNNVKYEVSARGVAPCPSPVDPNSDIDTESFTIRANPLDPTEKIQVHISGSVQKYTEDYFSAGKGPKATLYDSENNIVTRISLINSDVNKYSLLSPGEYTIVAEATWRNCENTSWDKAKISISFGEYTNIKLYEKPAGGVRVKSIKKYDADQSLLLSQNYSYVDEDGFSSGFVHREPNYTYNRNDLKYLPIGSAGGTNVPCNYIVALDIDRSSLGITNGSHLAYQKVTIARSGTGNGSTKLHFIGASNLVYDTFPFVPAVDRSHSNGKIISSLVYDNDHFIVQKQANKYARKETFTNALKVHFKGGALFNGGSENFDIGRYRILMSHTKIKEEETTQLLDGKSFTTINEYKYDNALFKLKEHITVNPINTIRKKYFYPNEYTQLNNLTTNQSNAYQYLAENNISQEPIQVETFSKEGNSEHLVALTRKVYLKNSNFSNHTLPASQLNAKSDNNLEPSIIYEKYDSLGNILQYKNSDDKTISYIWSYNKMYPVAKIENASFIEIANALGITEYSLKNFNKNNLNTLNTLRASLPNAMVSTYTYTPLVGIVSMTDPRGYTTYYEYDELNRLKFVKNNNGNLVSENKYNYKK